VRVLHIVAADRWTGAAAPALQLVEALRDAGVDATFVFRAGRNLEERLAGRPWAHAALAKERSLADLRAAVAAVQRLAAGRDIVHVHLPHDHLLARLAFRRGGPPVVRSVRHARHLRPDPFHRLLFRGTAAVALANSAMAARLRRLAALRTAAASVLPPVVEERFSRLAASGRRAAAGDRVRAALGIPTHAVLAGTVGKLDRGRGHDLLLRAVAAAPPLWVMLVGHGPGEAALRKLASRLGIGDRTVLAGYVGDGLEEHLAAMDLFVYPAAGSDHGHRAIAEAAGCGVPALAADLPGVTDLVRPGVTGELYPPEDAAALGVLLRRWGADEALRTAAAAASLRSAAAWTPARLAAAALGLYEAVSAPRQR